MHTEKLTTIHLGGQLGKTFGKTHKFYVSNPAEAVRAMCSQLEGFRAYMCDEKRQTKYKVLVSDQQIDPLKDLHDLSGTKEIRIAPVIAGAKNGIMSVVIGAVIIVASFFTGGLAAAGYLSATAAASLGSAMLSVGMAMALGGIAAMISPQPKLNIQEAPNNEPNTSLGVTNVTSQGRPVPIVYGECIVGSVVISAGIVASDTNV